MTFITADFMTKTFINDVLTLIPLVKHPDGRGGVLTDNKCEICKSVASQVLRTVC